MGEEPTTTDPQGVTPTGTDPQTATVTPQNGATPDAKPTTLEEALERLAQLERHAANKEEQASRHGKSLSAVQKELDAYKEKERLAQESQLSEQEKQTLVQQKQAKQLADLQAAHDRLLAEKQDERITYAIQLHALQTGIDPKLATRLLDRTALEQDENGNPTNLDATFKAMIKEYGLSTGKQQQPTSGGATNPTRSSASAQPLSWDIISKMTAQEYDARRAEIQAWINANPVKYGQKLK